MSYHDIKPGDIAVSNVGYVPDTRIFLHNRLEIDMTNDLAADWFSSGLGANCLVLAVVNDNVNIPTAYVLCQGKLGWVRTRELRTRELKHYEL